MVVANKKKNRMANLKKQSGEIYDAKRLNAGEESEVHPNDSVVGDARTDLSSTVKTEVRPLKKLKKSSMFGN